MSKDNSRVPPEKNKTDSPDLESIRLTDLFNTETLQKLQDTFANANGVSSIITEPDGTPITKSSNFCRLCEGVIRGTKKGLKNCMKSDAVLGRWNPEGPIVRTCLSVGLWDAGASISVKGHHIGNWLIGQVRNEAQDNNKMLEYAEEIGADKETFKAALAEVPVMSKERFTNVADFLFLIANIMSEKAYQNLQKEKLLHEKSRLEKEKYTLLEKMLRAEKMETIGRMAGGVAHDLNNMLGAILALPDLIVLRNPGNEQLKKDLGKLKSAGVRAASVVQDLLTLTRRGLSVKEVINMADLVKDYLQSPEYRQLIENFPNIKIISSIEDPLPSVEGSPVHISKSLMNLVTNAAEALNRKEGEITISLNSRILNEPLDGYESIPAGRYVVMSVSDNGHGIKKETLAKIFEPFYSSKKLGQSGTGLGMTVVWGTVKDHEGFLNVQSRLNQETTFELYFIESNAKPDKDLPGNDLTKAMGNKETILVVDDLYQQREIAESLLEALNYEVETAINGEEALEYLNNNKVDLILLDMIIENGISGVETYQEIRKLNPDQKILFCSGYSSPEQIALARSMGAVDFLKKPFTLLGLGTIVKKALKKGS